MIKLRSKRFFRSSSKLAAAAAAAAATAAGGNGGGGGGGGGDGEIKWELRPGGMLVQRRETGGSEKEGLITLRVSTVAKWHDITIQATSTFGELKVMLSIVTSMEPREQRLLFKGKEREDNEYLHMVGVRDNDKVLLFQDPSLKDRKARAMGGGEIRTPYRTITV